MTWLITLVLAYLIGAIPTAYFVAKKVAGIDIREHGSGNVGATNVMRVVGKKAGIFTLVCDFLKGLLPVLAVKHLLFPLDPWLHVAVALMLILGHSKSVYIGFKGGKSAVTGLGGLCGLLPLFALGVGVLAFVIFKLTRTVSIGSMCAAAIASIVIILLHNWDPLGYPLAYVTYTVMASLYIIYLHRANIQRLLSGQENKI